MFVREVDNDTADALSLVDKLLQRSHPLNEAEAELCSERLTKRQLEVMAIVWELGEVSVAAVWKVLARRLGVARNTVQTTMVRLLHGVFGGPSNGCLPFL